MTAYNDTIRKYATDDSRTGLLEHADGTGEVGLTSTEAGRKLAVRFTLQVAQNRIQQVRYQVFGCGFTIAACAVAAELVEGQPLIDAKCVNALAIDQRLKGLPDERSYCADLAAEALQAAISSLQTQGSKVTTTHSAQTKEHAPLVTTNNPVYRALINSPKSTEVSPSGRHLFACLLAVTDQETAPLHLALGLTELQLDILLNTVFPQIDRQIVFTAPELKTSAPLESNSELLSLLRSYLPPKGDDIYEKLAVYLTQIIAARAAHPGHLWVAMGLFDRPQLSAIIDLYLPLLLKANDKKMRWKRFLFKQICERNGGMMCKSPNCQDCSDYPLCFAE